MWAFAFYGVADWWCPHHGLRFITLASEDGLMWDSEVGRPCLYWRYSPDLLVRF